jgi:hypothetical protein
MNFTEVSLAYKGKTYKTGIELSGEPEHENEDILKIHSLLNTVRTTLTYLITGRESLLPDKQTGTMAPTNVAE